MEFDKDFNQISLALLKNPQSRSYDDLLCIRNFVFKLEWVKRYFENSVLLGVVNEFCRNLGIENAAKDDVLYKQGDNSDKLFFIIKGSCELRVTYKVDLTNDQFADREKIESKLTEGCNFGEEALELSVLRTSTAVVTSTAIFITIGKFTMRGISKELTASKEAAESYNSSSKAYILNVLSKRREYRSSHEIDNVVKYLTARIPFFMKFTADQQHELCRIAETVSFPEKKVLFKQGQVGQAFYIVLTGNVDVVKSDVGLGAGVGAGGMVNDDGSGGEVVNTMREGETFGEKALESTSSLRTATVVSSDRLTELLLIYKEDYYNIVTVIRHADTMEKIVLLRKNPIFKNADMNLLKSMSTVMESRSYRLDDVLFEEGERAVDMVFIRVGECRAEVTMESVHEKITDLRTKHYQRPKGKKDSDECINSDEGAVTVVKSTRTQVVSLGRIGPSSLLAPYVALCAGVMDEVHHPQKVIACTLLQTFVIWKNDFFQSIPEGHRVALQQLIQASPDYLLPSLWDTEPRKIGERQWKDGIAWKKFQKEMAARKPGADIMLRVKSLDHLQLVRTNESLEVASSQKAQSLKKSRSSRFHSMTCETPQTEAELRAKRSKELGIGMTKNFKDSSLVAESIEQSWQHKQLRDSKIFAASQPILRRCYNEDLPELDATAAASFAAATSTVPIRFGSRPSVRISRDHPYQMDENCHFKIDDLVLTSRFPIIVHPFTLIHIHRNAVHELPGGGMGGRRFMQCYFRLCGSLKTLSDAHDSALQQTKHAFLSSLQKSSGAIHEASPFSWSAFSSFENMNVAHSDFFIIYCRAVPIEFASFSPPSNMLKHIFPAEVKPTGQRFACVRFSKLTSIVKEKLETILTHPKYLQELAILEEVVAASFTLTECLRHLLNETIEGRRLRSSRIPNLRQSTNQTTNVAALAAAAATVTPRHRRSSFQDEHPHHTASNHAHDHHHPHHPITHSTSEEAKAGTVLPPLSENSRHYHIVPLFEWIAVNDNTIQEMSLSNIIFNTSDAQLDQLTVAEVKKAIPKAETPSNKTRKPDSASSTRDDDLEDEFSTHIDLSQEEVVRNTSSLKVAFSEVGLLKAKEESEVGSKTDKIGKVGFGKNTDHNPTVMSLEAEITRNDFDLELTGLTIERKEIFKEEAHSVGSESSSSQSHFSFPSHFSKYSSIPHKTTHQNDHHHLTTNPSASVVTRKSNTLLPGQGEEEKRARDIWLESVRQATANRSEALLINDKYCFTELYAPQLPRIKDLTKSSQAVLQHGESIDELWSEKNLFERTRRARHNLEEKVLTENISLRQNPVVTQGIEVRRVDCQIEVLDKLSSHRDHQQMTDKLSMRSLLTTGSASSSPLKSSASSTSQGFSHHYDQSTTLGSQVLGTKKKGRSGATQHNKKATAGASLAAKLDTLQLILEQKFVDST